MSPAAIVLSILNFFVFFLVNPFVSSVRTANPSKAELFADGFLDGDRISSEVTLFKAFRIEVLSSDNFREILSIRLIASLYVIILKT